MVFDHLPWFTLTSTRVLVVQQDVIMIVLELATGGPQLLPRLRQADLEDRRELADLF